jgi:ribonuclease VapC
VTAAVLDASALIALILNEAGADQVERYVEEAAISSVNLAEVVGYFAKRGTDVDELRTMISELNITVETFVVQDAIQAGLWRPLGETVGLSLGDRACLALANRLSCVALTADRAWARIPPGLGARVTLIR